MNGRYLPTSIGILDCDTQKWYEAEQCWNCEPEELRMMQIRNNKPDRKRFAK